jgi:hypothetical protein
LQGRTLRARELDLFNLGIDNKLRDCDLVGLRVRDVCGLDPVSSCALVMQQKTQRPVHFEIKPARRGAVRKSIKLAGLKLDDFVFPSCAPDSPQRGARQCTRMRKAGLGNSASIRPTTALAHS